MAVDGKATDVVTVPALDGGERRWISKIEHNNRKKKTVTDLDSLFVQSFLLACSLFVTPLPLAYE